MEKILASILHLKAQYALKMCHYLKSTNQNVVYSAIMNLLLAYMIIVSFYE